MTLSFQPADPSKPTILVANDDGIFSPGIWALGLALGIPSIAFSQQAGPDGEYDFGAGAAYAAQLAAEVLQRGLPPRTLLNVNFPGGPFRACASPR